MSLTYTQIEPINLIKDIWHHSTIAIDNEFSVLDLLYMWKKNSAINLSFLLNRAMELVGHKSSASLFYSALVGALDYDYDLATKKILRVATLYGHYFYSFWKDIAQK